MQVMTEILTALRRLPPALNALADAVEESASLVRGLNASAQPAQEATKVRRRQQQADTPALPAKEPFTAEPAADAA